MEFNTPQFEFRDLVFYLVPGGLVLVSAIVFSGLTLETATRAVNLATSLVGLLLAYWLGQLSYSLCYPLRWLLRDRNPWREGDPAFDTAYMWLIENHTSYFVNQVSRYRSFARFSLAMVVPTLLLGVSLAYRFWMYHPLAGFATGLGSALGSLSFLFRYRRYDREYRDQVQRCWQFDWKQKQAKTRSENVT